MDICSANYKSDFGSVRGFCESSKETPGCASGNPGGPYVNDLGHHLSESLNIEDGEDLIDKDNSNTLEEDGSEDIDANGTGIVDSEKGLIKSATFPCSSMSTPPSELVYGQKEQEVDANSTDLPYSRSISLPTTLKLVSAIKGSREKQGKSPRKLSVTWAPDVYDPIPTAVSHVPNKGQRHRSDNKRSGKNKQKSNGKSSRASKSKDKKQGRKHGGSAKRSYHHLEDSHITTCSGFHSLGDNITAHSSGLQPSTVDYDIGNTPDPFCGSSFLKKSVTKLHFPVAEAS
ncbi:PREDICTED: uncharacterized protein LOC109229523 [Nicotiana attenuata]|uniref:Uncharacterized protein n=1 Tax=Nicotiana attenuata TaxID=49451 RepID=A0A1J6I867_NICAT|nr:PREDICTED: uncharacterized protein LOC109229523 [Nicotiana attenuata]OIT01221.1 hypothetical protein A4A49_33004 [Nicotiana attenuata]